MKLILSKIKNTGMKLLKFIKKLFADFWYSLIYNEFFEAIGAMAFLAFIITAISGILGFIVDFLGIPCGKADNLLEKGTGCLIFIIITLILCGGLWAFCKLIVRFFYYLRKVWKELK